MIQALVIDYFFFHIILHESFSQKHDVCGGRGYTRCVRVRWRGREGGAAPPKDEKQVPKTQRSCTWYLIRIVSKMDKMTSAGAELIFNSIDDASAVLELARKYEMDAIIYRIGDFIAARFLPTHSLSVYAMSWPDGSIMLGPPLPEALRSEI
jgi:hypothetical protein